MTSRWWTEIALIMFKYHTPGSNSIAFDEKDRVSYSLFLNSLCKRLIRHYQYWLTVNCTLRNKLRWILKKNTKHYTHEYEFEQVFKIATVSFRLECANMYDIKRFRIIPPEKTPPLPSSEGPEWLSRMNIWWCCAGSSTDTSYHFLFNALWSNDVHKTRCLTA